MPAASSQQGRHHRLRLRRYRHAHRGDRILPGRQRKPLQLQRHGHRGRRPSAGGGMPGDQTVDPGPTTSSTNCPTTGQRTGHRSRQLYGPRDGNLAGSRSRHPAARRHLHRHALRTGRVRQRACCTFQLTVEYPGVRGRGHLNRGAVPQPARKVVYLSNPQAVPLVRLAIYDMTGRFVTEQDLADMGTQAEIDISRLSTATYMVIIEGQQGSLTKQLVKE